jgi:D-alanine transaminase
MRPNELLFLLDLPLAALRAKTSTGVSVSLVPDERWGRCDVKSTNLLGNVLAAAAAKKGGGDEAVLTGADGYVTEGAHTTFFGVLDEALVTTPLSPRILPGITRAFVTQLARQAGIPVVEKAVHANHVGRLGEAFLTGTVSEIFPVVRIDGRRVGDGTPGRLTRQLQAAYAEAISRQL